MAENREDAAFLARLKHAAEAWEANGEVEDLLFRGRVADDARRWYAQYHGELARVEQRFLEASLALAGHSQRRRRRVMASVTALSVLVAAGMSYLAWQERQAVLTARDATRLSAAQRSREDPTTQLALLREIEGSEPPSGWAAEGKQVMHAGVARAVLEGHTGAVRGVAWSPDGRRLASASADTTVRVWSADGSGEPLVLQGHAAAVCSVSWSPDGRLLASASDDKTA